VEVLLREVGRGREHPAASPAFADFVRANSRTLVRTAYLLTGSGESAEDLVQETFTRLYPQWERVQAADVPIAYVRRSLTNTFLNQRRRRSSGEIVTDAVPDRPTERSAFDDLDDRDEMWLLLGTLNQRQRAALVLRYYESLDDAQIAVALGCREGTVRSLISRGLATLREGLHPTAGRTL
jgi:RNA polymerase sigma-70 factor (sigma-E family)